MGWRQLAYGISALIMLAAGGLGRGDANAQEAALASRGPRFLTTATPNEAPKPLDVRSMPLLRRQIAVDLNDVTLRAALAEITRQTGLAFVYTRDVIDPETRVDLRAERISVAGAISEVLLDAGVDVLFSSSRQAALVKRTGAVRVVQNGAIVGRVTDAKSGEALAGAEVFLEGTRWRASTGSDGRYRLMGVEAGTYTLAARRVGYGKQSRAVVVAADQEVTVEVALQPVATQLNEIVTTVTGDQRRVELGHVVGRINADSLVKEAPVSTLSELLTARVPGLQVFQQQGTVGGRVVLRVRSPNSVHLSYQPIIVIDGVRYTNQERPAFLLADVEPSSPLNDLNPNDIESIEVVKGPSAATLYGTDAADGVVVITTKRGRPGPARWNAYVRGTRTGVKTQQFPDIYWGWGTVNGVPNNRLVSCSLRLLAAGQCTRQDSITRLPNPLNDSLYSIFSNKPSWEYGVNASGGQQNLRYYFSADFADAGGPLGMPAAYREQLEARRGTAIPEEWRDPNKDRRLNLRSNVDAAFGKRLDLGVRAGYVKRDTRAISRTFGAYAAAFSGVTPDSAYRAFDSPDRALAVTQSEQSDRLLGSASGQWRPLSWLHARATVGLDLTTARRYYLDRPGEGLFGTLGAVEDTRRRLQTTTADVGLTVAAGQGPIRSRTALGAQYVRNLATANGVAGFGLPPGAAVPSRATNISTRQQHQENVVLGGYVEQQLGWHERVFLTGALRMDGASTFGRGFDAAVYPKLSASWLVSEEPFVPLLRRLGEFRLRYAFGVSGKQPDPLWSRPRFSALQLRMDGQTVNYVDLANDGLPDPVIGPERTREHEFGFDGTMFGNRLTLDATWFRRRTIGMIVDVPGPVARGGVKTNLGLVTGRGFEAQLGARVLDTRLVSWDLRLQHSDFTTMLIELGPGDLGSASREGGYRVGYPLGSRFQRQIVGWQDVDGDGLIDRNAVEIQQSDTAVFMGHGIPPRSQTLTTVVGLFQQRVRLSALFERKSNFTQVYDLWCGTSSAPTCRAAVDRTAPVEEQVKALKFAGGQPPERADYTRLREVTVALDLPTALTRALWLGRGTVAFTGRNLALWTNFGGPDPEAYGTTAGIPNVAGVGGLATGIPMGRVYTVRVDLGF